MKKLTDEILNKYIDGELEAFELTEIKNELEKDEDALTRLKALKIVDNSLRRIEIEQAPVNFTERLMNAISKTSEIIKPKISYFFLTIVTLFSFGVLAVIISAFRSIEKENGQSVLTPYANKAKQVVENNLDSILKFFANQNVMFVAIILTLVLLISAYFTFESHKNFKNKLNRITQ